MSRVVNKIILPFAKQYALGFLNEKRIREKQDMLLKEKFSIISNTTIGKDLGVSTSTSPEKLPITTYDFFKKYFENPHAEDFMFPLDDYVKVITSGTMSKPKPFLLPKSGIQDSYRKTGFASMLISTHDGEKITFEPGDVAYTNVPGSSHISAFTMDYVRKSQSGWITQCPDPNLPFQAKVDYFVENYEKIDIAYMTVTTLLDEVYPRIGKSFYLKGFATQDRSAEILKEKIKKVTGNYPKVSYGSTEAMKSTIPSIEYPGGFFFDWRVIYPEFLPEDKMVISEQPTLDEPPETIPMMDVEVGKIYQPIITPLKNDITRYAMPDLLRCIDKDDGILNTEIPVFNYYSRADKIIVLHNFTRVVEEELLQVLKEAEIPFADFTVKRELEGYKEYMAMYLELASPMPEKVVYERIHEGLLKFDKDWHDLTNMLKYIPLKLNLLPKGSFNRYLRTKTGIPRIDRIEMRDENFAELIGNTETGKRKSD